MKTKLQVIFKGVSKVCAMHVSSTSILDCVISQAIYATKSASNSSSSYDNGGGDGSSSSNCCGDVSSCNHQQQPHQQSYHHSNRFYYDCGSPKYHNQKSETLVYNRISNQSVDSSPSSDADSTHSFPIKSTHIQLLLLLLLLY